MSYLSSAAATAATVASQRTADAAVGVAAAAAVAKAAVLKVILPTSFTNTSMYVCMHGRRTYLVYRR